METCAAGDENCRGTGGKLAQEVSLVTRIPSMIEIMKSVWKPGEG